METRIGMETQSGTGTQSGVDTQSSVETQERTVTRNRKKKRGCCGVFLILLVIVAALVGGGFYLVASGKLGDLYADSSEKIAEAGVALSRLDYDETVTGEVDDDFKKAVADYISFAESYKELVASDSKNIPVSIFRYIKTYSKAVKVEKDVEKLEGKTLTLSHFQYYAEAAAELIQESTEAATEAA